MSQGGAPANVGSWSNVPQPVSLKISGTQLLVATGDQLIIYELASELRVASPRVENGELLLRWTGGPGISLQSASRLQPGDWSFLSGADGQSQMQLPPTDVVRFYRAVRR